MRYGSVCSGIEAATAAWHHMGWKPAFFSEIEAFPRAVLEHHYPDVPLHGDFTTIEKNQYGKIDLLVGGTPCQSFSVAGLRGGLDDERGNLALEFCRLAQREQPRWIVWENVPGVLSSNGGRDFGSILGALEDLGYGLAYRVLDAQYFGVAQRRRRVFVVGYLGDWRPAAAVLFERHSMSGHPAPSREARKEAARAASVSTHECGGIGSYSESDVSSPLLRSGADKGHGCEALIARGGGLAVNISNGEPRLAEVTGTLDCWSMKGRGSSQQQAVLTRAFAPETGSVSKTVAARSDQDTASCVAYSIMPMNSGKDYKAFAQNTRDEVRLIGGDGEIAFAPETARTLTARYDGSPCHDRGPDVVAFAQNTRDEVRLIGGDGQISGALAAQPGMKQTTYVAVGSREVAGALTANYGKQPDSSDTSLGPNLAITTTGVRYGEHQQDTLHCEDGVLNTLPGGHNNSAGHYTKTVVGSAVRRLTPVECERLQGFPDNFTAIPWKKKGPEQCPDGPRYKALGNSMAVPVMRWIGERIQRVDDLISVL